MAEPWNRLNIPFPSATTTVHIDFTSTADGNIKNLLAENGKVLKLLRCEIFQTEIRVLYELLYMLSNNFRANKAFQGLQQVEQCVNRLKNMKLDFALQELTEVCPSKVKRQLGLSTGKCEVPSQPMLEWICLKVLGAMQLLSCALTRCSKTFLISKHLIQWEFIIVNMVVTSMLSRLWVIFRGILVGLVTLYHRVLKLLQEVTQNQPMPYLTDTLLPVDMTQFLGLSCTALLKKHPAHNLDNEHKTGMKKNKKALVEMKIKKKSKKTKEDLGSVVERDPGTEIILKSTLKILGKVSHRESYKTKKNNAFKKQVETASSFSELSAHLEEMIEWCKSRKMLNRKRLFTFLHLKCRTMKALEEAGHNVHKRLRNFKKELGWVSSPGGSTCRTSHLNVVNNRAATRKSRLRTMKKCLVSSRGSGVKMSRTAKQKRVVTRMLQKLKGKHRDRATKNLVTKISSFKQMDDIDDIFASAGF